ncbi:uncharacterized protein LOC104583726 [Brachypodium distachyon]|uniref:uncharacterized protein LOC104583726 n=1 Tax=Brachypodium distachyon TaxID=15368 RepID=UPI00052FFE83|nr:uncharacterized protein LOC104583726 [Brachypodium distachyon]|eukprot:XP_010235237.1 uncharacterized protein LOC104583726 [Brachypodium distachyon]
MSPDKTVRFRVTIESKQQSNESNQGVPTKVDEMDDELPHAPFFAWPKQAYDGEFEDDEPVGNDDEEEATNHHETEPKVKKLPFAHTCETSNNCDKKVKGKEKGRMANKDWIADKANEDVTLSAKALKDQLQKKYNLKLQYANVWKGRDRAIGELSGTYKEHFQLLWNFKAKLLAVNPGSVCEIDMKAVVNKKGERMYFFNRLFFSFKPCIDGFLGGCRPYLGVDSTFLTGKYTGQLVAAIAVDGHSWMFPLHLEFLIRRTQKIGSGSCNN